MRFNYLKGGKSDVSGPIVLYHYCTSTIYTLLQTTELKLANFIGVVHLREDSYEFKLHELASSKLFKGVLDIVFMG